MLEDLLDGALALLPTISADIGEMSTDTEGIGQLRTSLLSLADRTSGSSISLSELKPSGTMRSSFASASITGRRS